MFFIFWDLGFSNRVVFSAQNDKHAKWGGLQRSDQKIRCFHEIQCSADVSLSKLSQTTQLGAFTGETGRNKETTAEEKTTGAWFAGFARDRLEG